MFLFLSFLQLFKPCPHKKFFPSWVYELGLLAVLLCHESICYLLKLPNSWSIPRAIKLETLHAMFVKRWCSFQAKDGGEAAQIPAAGTRILDLPDLALDCVLEKLSPAELCIMAAVCKYLREICASDHLWRRHMSEKWSRVIGEAALRKRKQQVVERKDFGIRSKKRMGWLACGWPLSWLKNKNDAYGEPISTLPVDSLISFYTALENGRFTFPAQIYNRENGNAGFLLSCYDAEISYSYRKNKFYARYPAHGKRVPAIEEVPWERVRAPFICTSAYDLHISNCFNDLNPGDHIEIQWRRNKEFPYGWWYGIVGHLEICDRDEHHCCCNASDSIVLEFKQYAPGIRWMNRMISRREHREDGDENVGFYGGNRKVQKQEEISMWMQFWKAEVVG